MIMADVAQVDLQPFVPPDYDNYDDGAPTSSYAPPPEGKYVGKVPLITDEAFGATNENYLKVTIDPIELIGSDYKVRFTSLSAKKYKNREASQITDFLRACGIAARPKSNEELKQAIKMASGRTFSFVLQWEAFNKNTQTRTQGYDNFPTDPNNPAKRLSYVLDDIDPSKKWYANGRVRYFVSAVGGKTAGQA
jgi:hypothetical protein